MTSHRSKSLSEAANELYAAFTQAKADGYVVMVDQYGFIDLLEPSTGKRTPVNSGKMEKR